jgi:ParB family chromosome partitioning protein
MNPSKAKNTAEVKVVTLDEALDAIFREDKITVNGTPFLANTKDLRTVEPFQSLFPIREDVLARIVADMKKNGFDKARPITVWAGQKFTVVDGHTRLLAARKLGIPSVPIVFREFANEREALKYAIDSQRNRRNLTDAELLRCLSELDKRQKGGHPKGYVALGRSSCITARLLGTSRGKIEQLRTINDFAPETIKLAVLSGNLSANRAYLITMETRRLNKCNSEDEFKAERLIALEKSINKGIRERVDFEHRKHPDVRYTPEELHSLMGKIISRLKKELFNLKGN